MKKNFMFSVKAALAAVVALFSLNACSDSDDGGSGDEIKLGLVDSVSLSSDEEDDDLTGSYQFVYDDQNRLLKGATYTLTYAENELTWKTSIVGPKKVTLGANGKIVSDSNGNHYTYDSEGRLQLPGFTWENGNLTDGVQEYTDIPYKGNLGTFIKFPMDTALRIFGDYGYASRCRNLLKCACKVNRQGVRYVEYEYDYELNRQGYVTRLSEKWYYERENNPTDTRCRTRVINIRWK